MRSNARHHLDASTFTILALTCELMLVPAAWVIAWFFDAAQPTAQWDFADAGLAVLLTAPLLCFLVAMVWTPLRNAKPVRRIRLLFRRSLGNALAGLELWQILAVSFAAGLGEEVLFRGALQPHASLVITSLLFGALHWITPTYFVFATLMGLYLGAIYQWQGNLLVPIVIHALYDAVALLVVRAELRKKGLPRPPRAAEDEKQDAGTADKKAHPDDLG